jgi:PAS domain S-box-containing protein
MNASSHTPITGENGSREVLWEDGERVFCRNWHRDADGRQSAQLAVFAARDPQTTGSVDRLAHEFGLRSHLDGAWALRPLQLQRESGRTVLILELPNGEPLYGLVGSSMELGQFLRIAIGLSAALRGLHEGGLIHKDIKPSNVVVDATEGKAWLTGFGIASRLPRERQSPEPPEFIAGTLAYMAPEQTGRMNRSIDSRSDLYSLGVTLYQALTGTLPFSASDPMEWVHCHIARQPAAPNERIKGIPAPISAIIMKLLAKTPEERYQTASGVESDFRRSLADWETRGAIEAFSVGERDRPDRLLLPEKLYGRQCEINTLLNSFDRVVASGAPELVLVSGYSGIGKSSVVNELHKVLVLPRGLFASGKFDQHQRDIPYATLAQAFQGLIRLLLGRSESELNRWRESLVEALSPNAMLMMHLVPDLKFIMGEQPPVPDLPSQDAKALFRRAFRQFIGVFATPEHPLALFLDDLQWLDAATLDVLEDLLTHPDVHHLMLIGAYRNNEVGPSHPLMRRLEEIRQTGATMHEVTLAPLACDDLTLFVADALRCSPEEASPLAQLVFDKTAGNPFFAIQFISDLAEEALLAFDHAEGQWRWDLGHIHAKSYTDNVVDLMVGKLGRLPARTQAALQQLACVGNSAEFGAFSICHGTPEDEMHAELWDALRLELVVRLESSYKFAHDRIQEAAYSLIPDDARAAAHLRIGRLLTDYIAIDKREEAIFEIVGQLNRGAVLAESDDEREKIAELNLMAGKRAKASTAYTSSLKYLEAAAALLAEDCWDRRYDLVFQLELHRAECEFLTGRLTEAEERLATLSLRAVHTVEQSAVECLRIDLYMTLDRADRAVAVCLDYLGKLGIAWSSHPTREEAHHEYDRLWSLLQSRAIEELIDLPMMRDPTSLATLDVLTKVVAAALWTDANLLFLVVCRAVTLSLDHGNGDGSCVAYVILGMITGVHFGNYTDGYRLGRLGCDLIEHRGLTRFLAATYLPFADRVMPWTQPFRASRDLLHRTFEVANRTGVLTFATYSGDSLTGNFLAAGDPLVDVQRHVEDSLEFARKARFGLISDRLATQLALIRTLRGTTRAFGSFNDEQFDEGRMERHFAGNRALAAAECRYWIRKLQARFFAGEYAAAIDASAKARKLLWTSDAVLEAAEYQFYGALSLAAYSDTAPSDQRPQVLDAIEGHHHQLKEWATNCPENFATRAALVGAEIARLEKRELDAEQLYEQAIRSAQASGFVHNEALANELAARFYAARGFEKIARTYRRDARYGYLRWGADGKVRQLDRLHPHLSAESPMLSPTSTTVAPVDHLDLATVIKVSQAVSSEIVFEKLITTLMRLAVEQAGAERCSLILQRSGGQRVVAQATTEGDAVSVHQRDEPLTLAALPASIIHFVLRTREPVLLDDASARNPFADDDYLRQGQTRSVLCLPLVNQSRLIGALYLENNLAPGVFTPARLAVLKLLASQAAIAVENASLYRDVAEREAKIRRLVDANIIGTFIWKVTGQNIEVSDAAIVEANDAFLRMIGYDRADLAAGLLSKSFLSTPEGRDRDAHTAAVVNATGTVLPFEKEYVRKDGTRVPVLMGLAAFDERRLEGFAFVVDLTERKQAEAEARENERRYREVQAALAHAGRVASMGQITASIAHEVSQPVSGAITNAHTALGWLSAPIPDIQETTQALNRIIRDGNRAREIIERVRALARKAPARSDLVELNSAVREVVELTRSETAKNGISLRLDLADGLPVVLGDRVQLQQVVLNLIVNAIESMNVIGDGARNLLVTTAGEALGDVLVAVQDSGPGLTDVELSHLFDPFHTTKPDGLGLGLSICRSIVEAHGGRLWASANVPHGAVFQFTIPVAETAATDASSHAPPIPLQRPG